MKIKLYCEQRRPRVRLVPCFGMVREQTAPAAPSPQYHGRLQGVRLMAKVTMSDSQQVAISIAFTDKKGNPVAQPAGKISYLVDNPALLALEPAADSLSCVVKAVGPLGTGTVSVKLTDAADNTVAAGTIDAEIDAGQATAIAVTAGAPTEQA